MSCLFIFLSYSFSQFLFFCLVFLPYATNSCRAWNINKNAFVYIRTCLRLRPYTWDNWPFSPTNHRYTWRDIHVSPTRALTIAHSVVSQAGKMGLAGTHPGGLPFFCPNGDHLTQPPPAHMGIPPYGALDAGKAAAAAGEYHWPSVTQGQPPEQPWKHLLTAAASTGQPHPARFAAGSRRAAGSRANLPFFPLSDRVSSVSPVFDFQSDILYRISGACR